MEDEVEEIADSVLPGMQMYKDFTKEWNENQTSPSVLELITKILSDPRFYTEGL